MSLRCIQLADTRAPGKWQRFARKTKFYDLMQALVSRIEGKKPIYDRNAWINDRVQNLTYLQNIASYPEKYIEKRKEMETIQARKVVGDQTKINALRKRFLEPVKKKKTGTSKKTFGKSAVPEIPSASNDKLQRESSSVAVSAPVPVVVSG